MIGQTISHYTVLEKLGAGGMGEIYKAQDSRLNRFVAIKVLSATSAGDPERRRRFIQEAQAASALNHPNIITIYDVVSQDGLDFMVMEFVSGTTLDDHIPQSGMSVSKSLALGVQIADALQAAHAVGIIHRDLKPGNIMVTGTGLIKILDFGLAKLTGPVTTADPNDETLPLSAPMTIEGSILGTVSYMSPEQAEGRRVDGRSDVFSFGLVLYEMLTGRKAFAAGSTVSTLSAILRDEPQPIVQISPTVPPELEQIVSSAMRKDPAQRWQSMGDVRTALAALKQKYESGLVAVAPPPAARKPVHPAVWVGLAAMGATAVLLVAGVWWRNHRATPAPPQVVAQNATAPVPQAAEPVTQPASPPVEPAPHAEAVLTNQSVLDMLQAKVSSRVIIGQIRSSKTRFDLSTAEVIRLTKGGATPELIETMRNPKAPAAVATTGASTPSTPPPPPPSTSTSTATVSPPTPTPPAPEKPAVKGQPAILYGGLPLSITLTEDVPANPAAGLVIHFAVEKDFHLRDAVAIAKGTKLTGQIVDPGGEKKMLGRRTKATFKVSEVEATDGTKLKLRAAPGRATDKLDASIESPGRHDKDVLAPAGTHYFVYFDGDQTVTVQK